MKLNQNFEQLESNYLFSTISRKVFAYQAEHPDARLLHLGIGDVSLPLIPSVINALHAGVEDMAHTNRFRGYGPEQGYDFLRLSICEYYFQKGVTLSHEEIFISDGAKSDIGNILDLFGTDNTVLIPNPVYPAYVDTNIMAGNRIVYAHGTLENGFLPMPDETQQVDLIYLCSPNNPTGAHYTKEQLAIWVRYAIQQDAVLLFDSAYEAFVQDESLSTSIYEIEHAKECAIEVCSLSKTAGFTGLRCGYTVIPHALLRHNTSIHARWLRRQTTKFNGVPYIVQRGAQAVFTKEGQEQTKASIAYYLENAAIIADTLQSLSIPFTGGRNAPYLWVACPDELTSWQYFEELLTNCQIICTPGVGFGTQGEGYVRLSAFAKREHIEEAMRALRRMMK